MTTPAFQAMTVEEYLRSEPESLLRREYINGFVYTLEETGVSDAHALITGNLAIALGPLAKAKGYRIYLSGLLLSIPERVLYYYPDIMLTAEPFEAEARVKYAPCLLVEVLSKSTAHTDHFAKYHAYTALPSLQLYLLVEQTERRIYAYERTPQGWEKREYMGKDVIPLPFLDDELRLDDIYA